MPFPTGAVLRDDFSSDISVVLSVYDPIAWDTFVDGSQEWTAEPTGVIDNQAFAPVANYFRGGAFGNDHELALFPITTPLASGSAGHFYLYVRVTNPKTVGPSRVAYVLEYTNLSRTWTFYTMTNITITQIGSPTTLTIGQGIGFRVNGTTLEAWNYTLATDTWALVKTLSDSTYPTGTRVGFETDDLAVQVSEFWAGTLSPSVQTAAPASVISSGTWTPVGDTNLATTIDEAAASDAEYDQSAQSPATADIFEVKFATVTDPQVSTGHIVRYRYGKDGGDGDRIDLTVRLMQGATQIASWTHTDIPGGLTDAVQTLTGTQADAITDYTDLRLRFEAIKV